MPNYLTDLRGVRAYQDGVQLEGTGKVSALNFKNHILEYDPITGMLDIGTDGESSRAPVSVATTTTLPANTRTGNVLTANSNGALAAIDGVTLTTNDTLLVKNEASALKNGVYVVTDPGGASTPFVLTRRSDFDASAEFISGILVPVVGGAANLGKTFVLTVPGSFVLNTDAVTFSQLDDAGVFSVKSYGAVGNGSTNDTTAVANALAAVVAAGGGVLYFPPGSYLVDNLAVTTSNVVFRGAGREVSKFLPRQTGTRISFTNGTDVKVEDLGIEGTASTGFGGGLAVLFSGCTRPTIKRCRIAYINQGVEFLSCTDYTLDDVFVDRVPGGGGTGALHTVGTPAAPCRRGKVSNLRIRNQYNRAETLDLVPKTWVISTAYSVGDVVFIGANDGVYECVAAGTSHSSGTGPSQPAAVGEAYFTTDIVDGAGTLRWRLVCNNSWAIRVDSDTVGLELTNCEVHGCRLGLISRNDVGAGTIPQDVTVTNLKTFRTHLKGFSLDYGVRFKFHDCYVDYAVADHGIAVNTTFTGDVWVHDTWSRRNWNCGFSFFGTGPVEQHLRNCHFHDNSRAGSTVSAAVDVNNNTGLFSIIGCTMRGTLQSYGILIGSGVTQYTITNNTVNNNVTGGINLAGGYSTTGSIYKNRGHNEEYRPDHPGMVFGGFLTGNATLNSAMLWVHIADSTGRSLTLGTTGVADGDKRIIENRSGQTDTETVTSKSMPTGFGYVFSRDAGAWVFLSRYILS